MIVLPIAVRELRVAARASRTYRSRMLAAFFVVVIALVIADTYGRFGGAKVGGHQVFVALAYLGLAYCLFAGAALTADCLSSEKREETLGFLFLTDLKGYDVVLGKLFATSLRSVYGLLATFPILSFPLLLGGVRAAEFGRVILGLLNTLLLSLSVGLLVSTLFRRQRVTTHLAALLMLLAALVPWALGAFVRAVGGPVGWFLDPSLLSPIYTLNTAFDAAYRAARLTGASFEAALLTQFVVGILLLARASWFLPHSWQPKEATNLPAARPVGAAAASDCQPLDPAARRRLLDKNPFLWLAGRGSGMTWGMNVLIGVVAFWGFASLDDQDSFSAVQGVGILLVSLVLRLLIAFAGAQRLAEDKQSGALDLILTTPLTIGEILSGQWQAIWRKLGWPFVASLALFAFLILGPGPGGATSEQPVPVWWINAGVFLILTIADPIALGWLGMWAGLRIRQVPHAAALCLGAVVLPPALAAWTVIWIHGLTSADEYLQMNPYSMPVLWLIIGLAGDVAWTTWARRKLLSDFRTAATDRFQRTALR